MPELVGVRRNLWMTRAPGGFKRMNFPIDGLVFYVPLWHPELKDSSFLSKDLYAHTLTVYGATWGLQGRSFVAANSDYIDCGTGESLYPTTGLTILAWVKLTAVHATNYPRILGCLVTDGGVHKGYGIYEIANSYAVSYEINAGAGGFHQGSIATPAVNTWHLFGMTYDGSNVYPYYDGIRGSAWASIGTILYPAVKTSLRMCQRFSAATINGSIGEAWVYNRALTPLEMQRNYLATKWRYQ